MKAPIELELAGINSRVRIGDDGSLCRLEMSRVKNPVTGEEEELYLDKPTGFMSTRTELGTSDVFRLTLGGFDWDYTGRYAEHAEYSYSGPG